eukprot:06833_4
MVVSLDLHRRGAFATLFFLVEMLAFLLAEVVPYNSVDRVSNVRPALLLAVGQLPDDLYRLPPVIWCMMRSRIRSGPLYSPPLALCSIRIRSLDTPPLSKT